MGVGLWDEIVKNVLQRCRVVTGCYYQLLVKLIVTTPAAGQRARIEVRFGTFGPGVVGA